MKHPLSPPRKKTREVRGCFHWSLHTRLNWKTRDIFKFCSRHSQKTHRHWNTKHVGEWHLEWYDSWKTLTIGPKETVPLVTSSRADWAIPSTRSVLAWFFSSCTWLSWVSLFFSVFCPSFWTHVSCLSWLVLPLSPVHQHPQIEVCFCLHFLKVILLALLYYHVNSGTFSEILRFLLFLDCWNGPPTRWQMRLLP